MKAALLLLCFALPAPALAALNVGYGGAWYNPETPGQGLLVEVLESGQTLFVAWFTFAPEQSTKARAKVGAPEHRWLTAQGSIMNTRADLTLFNTRGGVFNAAVPVTTEAVGTAELEFIDCRSARFSYQLDDPPRTAEFDLIRISDGAVCDQLD